MDGEETVSEETSVNQSNDVVDGKTPSAFQINRDEIESVAVDNQAEELKALGLTVYNQSTFEEGILRQVDSAIEEQERLKNAKKVVFKDPQKSNKSKKSENPVVNILPLQEETEQDRLIRLGHMTPFGTVLNAKKNNQELTSFEKYLLEQEKFKNLKNKGISKGKSLKTVSRQSSTPEPISVLKKTPLPKKNIAAGNPSRKNLASKPSADVVPLLMRNNKSKASKTSRNNYSDSEYIPSDEEESWGKVKSNKKRKRADDDDEWNTDDSDWICSEDEEKPREKQRRRKGRLLDDGNVNDYNDRLTAWKKSLEERYDDEDDEEFEGGFKVPKKIWERLYSYQKVGVRWMWELHLQKCGGILGDEMGLGKTIQVIAFLAGLDHSQLISHQSSYRGLGPVLLITPATVMHQWVKEFHAWWPPLRVAILHDSGSHVGKRDALIRSVNQSRGVLITSYTGIVQHKDQLLRMDWDYVILDEGHKIRNPDAQATLCVKQFRTCHRFICSGSPMQNNLKELWSLFDFIFPGKLGTLPVFLQQFAVPITQGGYANASQVQVATAFKCATVLRDTINPYLLRRMKADVKDHLQLPDKNEQVLFCKLAEEQRTLYKGYLDSGDIKSIIDGRLQIFVGLTNLRKICNHPDLFQHRVNEDEVDPRNKFGAVERSGKMMVVDSLLRIWKEQKHRALVFSQSKKMLDVLETFVQEQGYTYLRLDGMTNIGSRQPMIDKFNTDPSIFVFLLTTRVGGLGVNLTGANRVIIYDPDWNPSTDTQARERAWRIGQQKDVTVYRLLTSGTIEEKIYHRQIFKQYLTNRVLKDPKQRRFFKSNDLYELFTLKEADSKGTETEAIFAGTGSEIATNHQETVDSRMQDQIKEDEWMKNWQKEREKREAAWKKQLEKEARKKEDRDTRDDDKKGSTSKEDSKRKKKKKKDKKEKKRVEIDGHNVIHIVKKSTYRSAQDTDDTTQSSNQDDYVLQRLFAKTGVLSALRHDSIMDAGDPDYVLVEGEAERVAKQAVQELKKSRRMCFDAQSGVPSWTGQNGGVRQQGAAAAKPRFGSKKKTTIVTGAGGESSHSFSANGSEPSSSMTAESSMGSAESATLSSSVLLKRMQMRNRLLGVPSTAAVLLDEDGNSLSQTPGEEENLILNSQQVPLEFATGVDYLSLMDDIRNFVAFRGIVPGQVTTEDILHQFNNNLPPKSAAIFRALLNELCNFHRDVHGQGVWELKPELK